MLASSSVCSAICFFCSSMHSQVVGGLLCHFGRKAHIILIHLDIRIRDVYMAAVRSAFPPAEECGDPLMHAEKNAGGRIGCDPYSSRHHCDVIVQHACTVFFIRQVAAWNHTAESAEDICGFLPPRCELALAGTDPHERLVKVAYDSLHIVLTVVLVKNEACDADCFFSSFSAVVLLLPFNSLI